MLDMRAIIGQLYIYLADFTALSQSSKQGTNAVFRGVLKSELPSEISVASMLESPIWDLEDRRFTKKLTFFEFRGHWTNEVLCVPTLLSSSRMKSKYMTSTFERSFVVEVFVIFA